MKAWNYIVIIVFVSLLFEMGGIPVASALLNSVGLNVGTGLTAFQSGTFWIFIAAILAGGAAGGIAVGFITKSPTENYVLLPIIILELTTFAIPFTGIVTQAKVIGGWVFYITLLIVSPLAVGFVVALYEHFRGTD